MDVTALRGNANDVSVNSCVEWPIGAFHTCTDGTAAALLRETGSSPPRSRAALSSAALSQDPEAPIPAIATPVAAIENRGEVIRLRGQLFSQQFL